MKRLVRAILALSITSVFLIKPLSAQIFGPDGDIYSVTPQGGPGIVVLATKWTCIPEEGSALPRPFSGTTQQFVTPDWKKAGDERGATDITILVEPLPESVQDGLETEIDFHTFKTDEHRKYKGDLFAAQLWGKGKIVELQFIFPAIGREGEFLLYKNYSRLAKGKCSFERIPFDAAASYKP